MKSSFNQDRTGIVFAYKDDINASYKQLGAVCDAIRYMNVPDAMDLIDRLIAMEQPILFRKHNTHMGARHELGGRKGSYPVRAAKQVRLVLLNAIGNAKNYGLDGNDMIIVHACANKTTIQRRYPPKGALAAVHGSYMGITPIRRMDFENAKIEIGLGNGDEKGLSKNMRYFIKKKAATSDRRRKAHEKKLAPKKQAKPKEQPKEKPKEQKKEMKATATS